VVLIELVCYQRWGVASCSISMRLRLCSHHRL
jgi:hypothetical protein